VLTEKACTAGRDSRGRPGSSAHPPSPGGRLASLFALALGLFIWELSGRLYHYAFLPPFSNVLLAGYELIRTGQVLGNLWASVVSLLTGYGLAACSGVVVGALMGRFRKVEYFLDIYLSVFLASPSLIYAPVLFAFFGISRLTQTAIVFMSSFFVVVANTMAAVRSVDGALLEMGRSFGAKERQLFRKIFLPSSLPMILAGLRLGMARAFKGMISGEMYIALIGLGASLRLYGSRFQADRVLAILSIVVALALLAMGLMEILERRLNRWRG
jgi:NitT/TauT family transport system permease protein